MKTLSYPWPGMEPDDEEGKVAPWRCVDRGPHQMIVDTNVDINPRMHIETLSCYHCGRSFVMEVELSELRYA